MREGEILKAEGIFAGYGDMEILHGVSIEVREGEIVCIIGPNGSGKSTLLKVIVGLLRPRKGHVFFNGQDITGFPPHRIAFLGLSYVPQTDNVFLSMTVQENLEMGGYLLRDGVRERIEALFDLFPDLRERRHTKVSKLSGGQRQMVALARALMLEPKLLILDEPSASLSPIFVDTLFQQIHRIHQMGTDILIVEQNVIKGLENSDRCYVLVGGENRFEGKSSEILRSEELGRLYLGR